MVRLNLSTIAQAVGLRDVLKCVVPLWLSIHCFTCEFKNSDPLSMRICHSINKGLFFILPYYITNADIVAELAPLSIELVP
jgi:hypothetical protein